MKAIFVTGGKQYYVSEGDTIYVEKLANEVGSEVSFETVLFVDGKAGNPYVDKAKVVCTVERHGRQKKIVVFKYRPKKKYRKKQGHRQPYTKLTVKKIEVK
ncbi:MAG: 50S ribosomal protein L21 [Bacilli bacterium]|jgi:large subunit ribosomal protein L21|nr:50S ribosomal protein L21 [Bacilli bacterium]